MGVTSIVLLHSSRDKLLWFESGALFHIIACPNIIVETVGNGAQDAQKQHDLCVNYYQVFFCLTKLHVAFCQKSRRFHGLVIYFTNVVKLLLSCWNAVYQ